MLPKKLKVKESNRKRKKEKDLGPTHIDFNLGTPRSEILSHYPNGQSQPL